MASLESVAKAVEMVAERVGQAFNEPDFHDKVKNVLKESKSHSKPRAQGAGGSTSKSGGSAAKSDSEASKTGSVG